MIDGRDRRSGSRCARPAGASSSCVVELFRVLFLRALPRRALNAARPFPRPPPIAPAYHQSMGEAPDDAPTDYAPTELGAAIDETEAHKAWALADEPDEWPRFAKPLRFGS